MKCHQADTMGLLNRRTSVSRYAIKLKPLLKKGIESHRGHWPEIARRAGVSYSTITHIMQNSNDNPGLDTIQAILNVLDAIEEGKIKL